MPVNKKSPPPPLNAPINEGGLLSAIWQDFFNIFYNKTLADIQKQIADLTQVTNDLAATVADLQAEIKRNGISASNTEPTKVLQQTNNGTDVTVAVIDHVRRYDDYNSVAITGGSSVTVPYNTLASFYYDDADRVGGAIVLKVETVDHKIARHNYIEGRHSLGQFVTMGAVEDTSTGLTGTVTDPTSTWVNPGNAETANNAYASRNIPSSNVTPPLIGSSYGAAVPSGATVTGIALHVKRYASGPEIRDSSIRIRKAGVATGDDKAQLDYWPTSNTEFTYGGSSDLWGTTWTPADVNDTGFGAELSAVNDDPGAMDAFVDAITVTVYYTEATTGETSVDGGTPPPGGGQIP